MLGLVNCVQGNDHLLFPSKCSNLSSVRRGAISNTFWHLCSPNMCVAIFSDSRIDTFSLHPRRSSVTESFASYRSAFFHRFKHDNSILHVVVGKHLLSELGMKTTMV